MKSATPIIPIQDFQRISNAVAGMILAESGQLIGKCVLFGIMGERLLRQRYKIKDARAVVGAFSVCVAPTKVMSFAGHDGTTNNRQNFHCWVEAGGFVFDFSSFLYPVLARQHLAAECPSFMFQKHASKVAESMYSLQEPGDFYFLEDRSLQEETINATLSVQHYKTSWIYWLSGINPRRRKCKSSAWQRAIGTLILCPFIAQSFMGLGNA